MALKITNSAGKSYLMLDNFKFRRSRTLQNGSISWRCCVKDCKCSIKTNNIKTSVLETNNTHNHKSQEKGTLARPGTLRRVLTRPAGTTPVAKTTISRNSSPANSLPEQTRVFSNSQTSTPMSSPFLKSINQSLTTTSTNNFSPSTHLHTDTPELTNTTVTHDTSEENAILKKEIKELKEQMKVVLDHSVESDLRLLQFTDQVFTARPTSTLPTAAHEDKQIQTIVTLSGLQDIENKLKAISTDRECLEAREKEHFAKISLLEEKNRSLLEENHILKEEAKNMIHSIRCFEEEICSKNQQISQLNEELATLSISSQNSRTSFNHASPSPSTLPLNNRFEPLLTIQNNLSDFQTVTHKKLVRPNTVKKKPEQTRMKSSNTRKKPQSTPIPSKYKLPFPKVSVVGDSHARYLAALMAEKTTHHSKITGMCKPGAGLLDVAPAATTLPTSQPDCIVLLAGTNDVTAGRQDNIFLHLEGILKKSKEKSQVLVCPLLTRHDLSPASPIHGVVSQVNHYIAELCVRIRIEGVELLDISSISRKHFTSHGLHLRASGKRWLAGLIVERLAHLPALPAGIHTSTATHPPGPPAPSQEPRTLPFETYAEAVTRGPYSPLADTIKDSFYNFDSVHSHCFKRQNFLGNPLGDCEIK